MKSISKGICILLTILSINTKAQEIFGDWVKTKITYSNGTELPNDNEMKYNYYRFTFERANKFSISLDFDDKGKELYFEINSNIIQIRYSKSVDYVMNSFQIINLTNDEMVLVQKNKNGFNDDNCLKYYFTKEKIYQNLRPIQASDIVSIINNDTVYRSTPKIFAKFLNDKSFFNYCSENIQEYKNVQSTNSSFLATFIVRKTGLIDSIRILNNLNNRFEKQFLNVLNNSKNQWQPAEIGDRKVDVQMQISFSFISSSNFIPYYDYSNKGTIAYNKADYLSALTYFNLALKKIPNDNDLLYLKAICEMKLGNKTAACEDLMKLKIVGINKVDDLIEKNCK